MKFIFAHNNINVLNLEKSLEFYKKALQAIRGAAARGAGREFHPRFPR